MSVPGEKVYPNKLSRVYSLAAYIYIYIHVYIDTIHTHYNNAETSVFPCFHMPYVAVSIILTSYS